ncbi:hypothetical protein N9242_07435, partial [Vicingaceae bacterium]|nr:hypothetical protein [Vicingaceae bacterium]
MTQQLHKIENVNGTDLLFQIPTPFVSGSLKVLIVDAPSPDVSVIVEEMGTSYFKMSSAPAVGVDLWCYYN